MNITVLGMGRAGAVIAATLADAGHDVVGLDINPDQCAGFNRGDTPFYEPGLHELIKSVIASGRLRTFHPDDLDHIHGNIVVICVGTPALKNGGTDLSQVEVGNTMDKIQGLRRYYCGYEKHCSAWYGTITDPKRTQGHRHPLRGHPRIPA